MVTHVGDSVYVVAGLLEIGLHDLACIGVGVGAGLSLPVREAAGLQSLLGEAAERFAAAAELSVDEVREGKVRRVDVRRYVESVSVSKGPGAACVLDFRAAVTPSGTARAERVVEALGRLAGLDLEIEWIGRMQVELA